MPSLIPEILSDIKEKLIKDGDYDAVLRFALSGKEPFEKVNKMFVSITNLELNFNNLVIGAGDQRTKLSLSTKNGQQFKILFQCLPNSVKHLTLNVFTAGANQQIFDNISADRQLLSLRIPPYFANSYTFNKFLPTVAATLKHLSIPNRLMNETIRDTLNLDLLTIADWADSNFFLFCCKTVSLNMTRNEVSYFLSLLISNNISPHLSSIKELTFYSSSISYFELDQLMKHIPSLELLQFTFTANCLLNFLGVAQLQSKIRTDIDALIEVIQTSKKLPSKIMYSFHNCSRAMDVQDRWEYIYTNFELDESFTDFWCFRKTIQSAGTQSASLEIQIFK